MKRPLAISTKFEINWSTIIIIALALLSGRYKTLFIQYMLTLIHELFHCLGALFFKVEIAKVEFLPFGFYAQMENLYTKKWYQELIIVILGPLSYFVSIILLKQMYIYDMISYVGLMEANQSNLFILVFNLLPIYPLDGSIILRLGLERFFTQKIVLKIIGIISSITTVCLLIFTLKNPQLILIGYLIYSQCHYWIFLRRKYRMFLLARSGEKIEGSECLHSKKDLYRPKYNIIINEQKIYYEAEYAKKLLAKRNEVIK